LRGIVAADGPVTLIYSARDRFHNQAVVLAELLHGEATKPPRMPDMGGHASRSASNPGAGDRT
jgi:hypothetical protein